MATHFPCPLLPCLFPGCKRWFKNQTGLKCHARMHPQPLAGQPKGDNGNLDDDTMEIIDDLNSMGEDSSNTDDVKHGEYMYEHI